MDKRKNVRLLLTLILVFCMLFSLCGTLSANSLMTNKPQFYAEFINTRDTAKYYVLLLAKRTDGSDLKLVSTALNESEVQAGLLNAYYNQANEQGVPRYVMDGVDTFLAQCDCLDGFVYDEDMSALECCFGDSIINYYYIVPTENCIFRFLFYWPDSGEYKLSDTFSLEKINQIRIDMSEEAPYYSIIDLEYAYDLNALIPGVAFHLVITLIIETLVAVFFKLRTKKQLATILVTNTITNIAANLVAVLSVMHYIQFYLVIELVVFIVELIVYRICFKKEVKTGKLLLFSFAANLMSAVGGFFAFLTVLTIVGIT